MVKLKSKAKVEEKPSFNLTEMQNTQLEFFRVKEQKKLLEKRETELKKRLDDFMTRTLTPDTKGHYLFSTVDENGNKIHLQKQARKSIKLNNERALEFFNEHNLTNLLEEKQVIAEEVTQDQVLEILEKHAPHLLDKKVLPDEVAIEQALGTGSLSMDDFEKLCDINVTYAMTFVDDKKIEEGDDNATKGRRKKV